MQTSSATRYICGIANERSNNARYASGQNGYRDTNGGPRQRLVRSAYLGRIASCGHILERGPERRADADNERQSKEIINDRANRALELALDLRLRDKWRSDKRENNTHEDDCVNVSTP